MAYQLSWVILCQNLLCRRRGVKQDDQLEHTSSSYVRIRDVAMKTCQRRWTIGRSGERGSRISVPAARHDGDDDDTWGDKVVHILSKIGEINPTSYPVIFDVKSFSSGWDTKKSGLMRGCHEKKKKKNYWILGVIFLKGISSKVNVMTRLEIELNY